MKGGVMALRLRRAGLLASVLVFVFAGSGARDARAQAISVMPAPPRTGAGSATPKPLAEALAPEKWRQVEAAVDRALAWMASRQGADGSFPAFEAAQPAVTSLCVLAFLSRGHQPGLGPYGERMNRGIDFVLASQTPDGLFSFRPPESVHIDRMPSHTAAYNHAIAGLMLGEVYGHVSGDRARAVKTAIGDALRFSRKLQSRPKAHALDHGGWRYIRLRFNAMSADSDLSVTAWQLMFLRSARNAEFNVPQGWIDEAMEYVRRTWDPGLGQFDYAIVGQPDIRTSRGIMGAGILSLSLGGQHKTPMAEQAGDWLLRFPYRGYGELVGIRDRFFYSAYYCSQAMAQLGGRYWERFFPPLADSLLSSQRSDGSWPEEPGAEDRIFGNLLTTSLAVLSLTPPYQLLPVYQR
jgi:hypothetical protein